MSRQIVFNLTIKLSKEDTGDWLNLMTRKILPDCTDGQIILSSQINRILTAQEDGDDSFAVQFIYPSVQIFEDQKLETMKSVLDQLDEQFRGRYVYFGTMMELIHQQE